MEERDGYDKNAMGDILKELIKDFRRQSIRCGHPYLPSHGWGNDGLSTVNVTVGTHCYFEGFFEGGC